MTRYLWLTGAYLSLGMAILGALLPLLPTVPFLLLAGACFSKSSPRMKEWLESNPHFGPLIRDYRAGRGFSASVKKKAILMICISMGFSAWMLLSTHWSLSLFLVLLAMGLSTWLWTRPSSDSQ